MVNLVASFPLVGDPGTKLVKVWDIFQSLSCKPSAGILACAHFLATFASSVLKPKWGDKNHHMFLRRASRRASAKLAIFKEFVFFFICHRRQRLACFPCRLSKLFLLAARTLRDISNSLSTRNGDLSLERNLRRLRCKPDSVSGSYQLPSILRTSITRNPIQHGCKNGFGHALCAEKNMDKTWLPSIKEEEGKTYLSHFVALTLETQRSPSSKQMKSSSNRILIESNVGKNWSQTVPLMTIYPIKQPHFALNIPKSWAYLHGSLLLLQRHGCTDSLSRPLSYPKDKTINFAKQMFSTPKTSFNRVPFQRVGRYFPEIQETRRYSHY